MTEITPHIIYDNDGELFMGYTSPLFCNTLHQKSSKSLTGSTTVEIVKALQRCRTFEDFPMSMRDLILNSSNLHMGDDSETLKLENLFFRSLADILNQKSPVKKINLNKEYNKFWHSDYIFIYNLSNKHISVYDGNSITVLAPAKMIYYNREDNEVNVVAVSVLDYSLIRK